MPECKRCGSSYKGDDCDLCKTTTGINLQELMQGVIITSSLDPSEESAVYLEEGESGERYPVPVPMCRVGRDQQNDVVITGDNGVSRNQFVITFEDGYFYLMDLGSRNGTRLNGKAMTERTNLSDGDYIQIGSVRFRFLVAGDLDTQLGHDNFIRYLESKQSAKPSNGDTYQPMSTMEADMPEETLAALEKVFAEQNRARMGVHSKEGKHMEGAEQEMTAEVQVQEESEVRTQEWCPKYMQDELARLEKEINNLNEVVSEARKKIHDCEGRIKMMKSLTKSLLSGCGDELVEACARVLQLMGWRVGRGEKDKQELLLTGDVELMAIVRVSGTTPQGAKHDVDLGTLAISQVFHWIKSKAEPKGVMIVKQSPEGEGTDNTFDAEVEEFARKKNVCILTTTQLLYMFRELNQDMEKADAFKQSIVSTVGVLQGYGAESASSAIAA